MQAKKLNEMGKKSPAHKNVLQVQSRANKNVQCFNEK